MTADRLSSDRLIKAVEELSAEVHVLGDILEELRTDLIHELRNRYNETLNAPRATNGVPESLCCYSCDAGQGMTLAEALQEGWTDLQRADGASANYHGLCVTCQQQEIADETAKVTPLPCPTSKKSSSLFPTE